MTDASSSTAAPHGFVTRSIHWLSAGLIGYGYFKGLDDVSQLALPGLLPFEVGFALLLGLVFVARLIWTKRVAGASRLPDTAPRWERSASRWVHAGLYVAVFGIVLSGLGIALAFTTPALGGVFMAAMIGLHEIALMALPALLVTHIVGALWHKFIRRDGVMESMTGRLPV